MTQTLRTQAPSPVATGDLRISQKYRFAADPGKRGPDPKGCLTPEINDGDKVILTAVLEIDGEIRLQVIPAELTANNKGYCTIIPPQDQEIYHTPGYNTVAEGTLYECEPVL